MLFLVKSRFFTLLLNKAMLLTVYLIRVHCLLCCRVIYLLLNTPLRLAPKCYLTYQSNFTKVQCINPCDDGKERFLPMHLVSDLNWVDNWVDIRGFLFKLTNLGCRHSSVNSSAPTILPPRVRVPSTPSMLLSFIVTFVLYLSCEKNEINKKRPGLAHF